MRSHTPPGLRKSGMPDSVEMPAPVKTTADADRWISSARRSISSGAVMSEHREHVPDEQRCPEEHDDRASKHHRNFAAALPAGLRAPLAIVRAGGGEGEDERQRAIKRGALPHGKRPIESAA